MQNKRAWLRDNGFPNIGKRGKFSAAMLEALKNADVEFEEPQYILDKTINEPQWVDLAEIRRPDLPDHYIIHVPQSKQRKAHDTTWSICYKCGYSIQYCRDPRPMMPPWMDDANVDIEPVYKRTST